MADDKLELIYVIVNPERPNRVGLYEIHPDHPGGTAWVAGDEGATKPMEPVQIALTPFARQKLAIRDIVQVFPQKQVTLDVTSEQEKVDPEPNVPPVPIQVYAPAKEVEPEAEQPAPAAPKKGKRF